MKLASEGSTKNVESAVPLNEEQQLLETLNNGG